MRSVFGMLVIRMSVGTLSERVARDYFVSHDIPCDEIPRGNAATPDFRISVGPDQVIVEVKEFGRSEKQRTGGFYPVPFVRRKIIGAWRQFESHVDKSCCLMLFNAGSQIVFLQPDLILSAMFGEFIEKLDSESLRFHGAAAMQPDRNTIISAVVALLPLRVYCSCIEAGRRIFELSEGFTRLLTDDEELRIHHETSEYQGQVESVIRAVVVENPFARNPLPENVFSGPFDERWMQSDDGTVRRKFSGARVTEMRALLDEYYLKMMGLW